MIAKESASANHPRPRSSIHQYDWKLTTSLKQLVPQTALFAEANGKHAGSPLAHPKHFLVHRTNRQSEDSWSINEAGLLFYYGLTPWGTSQQWKKFLDLRKLKSSLPCSQQSATFPCPEPGESIPSFFHTVSLRHILILLCNVRLFKSPKRSSCLRFSNQKPRCISVLPHALHMPFHLILLHFITLMISGEEFKSQNSSL